MNSFQNVFSACVDKVKVRDGAGRAHVVSKADGKRAAEGRLEPEPASAFSDKREDPKISALRLKLEPLDARRQNWPSSLHNKLWMEPPCKAKRHLKLALPYLTRLLNGESS